MNMHDCLKELSMVALVDRDLCLETIKIKNYGSNILTEHAMWILTNATNNEEYLAKKLRESELQLDVEAPIEIESEEEVPLDEPTEEEVTIDEPSEEEVTLDEPTEEESKIETSLEGAGILPLLAEIQDKLANGKPSEMEIAALKALKKLFKN